MLYDAYFKHTGTSDLLTQKTRSLLSTESAMMANVTDYNVVDVSKLPDRETIMKMYGENTSLGTHVRAIADAFEFKRNILIMLQGGLDIKTIEKGIKALAGKNERYESVSALNEEIAKRGVDVFIRSLREGNSFFVTDP